MKPFIVGVGRAGCRVADQFFKDPSRRVAFDGLLVDTEESELSYYSHRHKFLLGKKILDGNGTGKDVGLGKEVMDSDKYHIVEAMDEARGRMDAILVISGIGGGTGGAVDVLMEELKKSYTEPVYYACILPSVEDPEKTTVNFAEQFRSAVSQCDAIFPIDNDYMKQVRLRSSFAKINKEVLRHFRNLFEVGEYRTRDDIGENVINASDIVNTLRGITSIGIGSQEVDVGGMFVKQKGQVDKPGTVVALTKEATKKMIMPFDPKSSQKALCIVSGPKRYLDFLASIPSRLWVERNYEGCEVRGGDLPAGNRPELNVTVVLSGIRKSDRIKGLYRKGKLLRSEGGSSEKVSSAFIKAKNMSDKIKRMDRDFDDLYEDIKEAAMGEQAKEENCNGGEEGLDGL